MSLHVTDGSEVCDGPSASCEFRRDATAQEKDEALKRMAAELWQAMGPNSPKAA